MTNRPIDAPTRTWARWPVGDPRLGMVAETIDRPSDWQAQGTVTWEGAIAKVSATLTGANGDAAVQFMPPLLFAWPGNLGRPDGYGNIFLPPQPVARQLAEFLVPMLRGQAQNVRILGMEPADPRHGFPVSEAILRSGCGLDAARAQLTYVAGNRLWREELLALGVYPAPVRLPLGTMVAHSILVIASTAETGRFDAELDTMRRIAGSARLEPAWEATATRIAAQADQQSASALAAERNSSFMNQQNADTRLMQGYADLRAAQTNNLTAQFDRHMSNPAPVGPAWDGQQAQDAMMDAALMGRAAVADPTSSYGNVQYVDAGAAVVWQNERGETIETDDVNLDPRINSHDTWRVVRRYGE